MSALDTITAALSVVLPNFNKSAGTIEAKIIDVVGTFADTDIIERNNTLEIIQNALANQRVTTVEYYRRKAVLFQVGDTLFYDPVNQGGYYPTVDASKQIIKQAYVIGSFPEYTLLVNALDSTGHLRPLTTDELAGFSTYFQAFQPLGLDLNLQSLQVAKITDPGIIVYIKTGSDATNVASKINDAFLAYEQVLRTNNTVSLSEIEDVIQSVAEVVAVGMKTPVATEQNIDGSTRTVYPVDGLFKLLNGAFTFATEITVSNIKTLQ